jgi:hypothetical protein
MLRDLFATTVAVFPRTCVQLTFLLRVAVASGGALFRNHA